MGNALEFINIQNAKIFCQLMVIEQGIAVSGEIVRRALIRSCHGFDP